MRIRPGTTVALSAESGSGKSVTAQAIMGIPAAHRGTTSGEILFNDRVSDAAISPSSPHASKVFPGHPGNLGTGMIFQEPMTSISAAPHDRFAGCEPIVWSGENEVIGS